MLLLFSSPLSRLCYFGPPRLPACVCVRDARKFVLVLSVVVSSFVSTAGLHPAGPHHTVSYSSADRRRHRRDQECLYSSVLCGPPRPCCCCSTSTRPLSSSSNPLSNHPCLIAFPSPLRLGLTCTPNSMHSRRKPSKVDLLLHLGPRDGKGDSEAETDLRARGGHYAHLLRLRLARQDGAVGCGEHLEFLRLLLACG